MGKSKAMPSKLRRGQTISLNITDSGHNGDGVGRCQGMAIFVPGAAPGDTVTAQLTQVSKNYGRAALVTVEQPSPDRVTPRCPFFAQCGGCQIQHIDYAKQLELKRSQIVAATQRLADVPPITVHPTRGMKEPWYYRNKAQFPVVWRQGKPAIGFYAPQSHDVVAIDGCYIQHPLIDTLSQEAVRLLGQLGISVYDEAAHQGTVRHIIVRIGYATDEAMVIFVTNSPHFPQGEQLAKLMLKSEPRLKSVIQNINDKRTNVIMGEENVTLGGEAYISDTIGDFRFRISPTSFFQVNPEQTAFLYDTVLQYAALQGNETVVDIYCGIGTISLALARQCGNVIGIEWVAEAVADAQYNASLNRMTNARFIAGDATQVMSRLTADNVRADVIVVDPPRKGCEPDVLEAMVQMGPDRIVYVSCNPASLARDIDRLYRLGYHAVMIQPVDMFPHTAHVESCTLLVPATTLNTGG